MNEKKFLLTIKETLEYRSFAKSCFEHRRVTLGQTMVTHARPFYMCLSLLGQSLSHVRSQHVTSRIRDLRREHRSLALNRIKRDSQIESLFFAVVIIDGTHLIAKFTTRLLVHTERQVLDTYKSGCVPVEWYTTLSPKSTPYLGLNAFVNAS